MKTEDEVVIRFAEQLRARGWLILAEGGNQATAFRYSLGSLTKAPDLVALRGSDLLVGEGKVRARDLLIPGNRGISDLETCVMLADSADAQVGIAAEAVRRCGVSLIACPAVARIVVRPVLFAHHVSARDAAAAEGAGIPLYRIN